MSNYKFILPIYGVIAPSKKVKSPTVSANWYRNAHYRTSNNAKKKFKQMIKPQLDKFDPIEGKLKIHYIYYAKRNNTDLDNFVSTVKKWFQDALTECGLIEDDNCNVIVKNSEEYAGIDKDNPRIEAEITVLN